MVDVICDKCGNKTKKHQKTLDIHYHWTCRMCYHTNVIKSCGIVSILHTTLLKK